MAKAVAMGCRELQKKSVRGTLLPITPDGLALSNLIDYSLTGQLWTALPGMTSYGGLLAMAYKSHGLQHLSTHLAWGLV